MNSTFLVKKDVTTPCTEDNWILMKSSEFRKFIKSDEGQKRKRDFARLDACSEDDSVLFVECGYETAKEMNRDRKKQAYRRKMAIDAGETCFSDVQYYLGQELLLEEMLLDDTASMESRTEQKHLLAALNEAIWGLSEDDRTVLFMLYFSETPVKLTDYAKVLGVSKEAVFHRKQTVLRHLKKFLQNWN